ncbi:MAG: dTDP-glucose 4,6-dehydratase [Deltaproteobacteria bacterium]|nr:dTDP-glucose 4,6-dehydratase [Deltaproteobacteria bacterium]
MATRWFVTGGAGFIGANFVRGLLARRRDSHVTVYDALTYAGHEISLDGCTRTGRFALVRGDVCDADALDAALRDASPDVIVHMAAESHVDRSIHGPAPFLRTNVDGTFRVLEAVRARPGLRVAVVSTDEVYGSLGPTGRFVEGMPLAPSSPYSASKAAADLLTLAYVHTYGLDAVITRCSNNYGPYQMPEKLIPLMILSALRDQPLPVYGDGMNVRDWIFVDDHCAGIELAAERGRAGREYNFGGECEKPNLEVVETILRKLDKPRSLIRFVTDRPGHDRRYAMDIARATEELGFRPSVDFETGMERTLRWYQDNLDWCAAVEDERHRTHMRANYERRLEAGAEPSADRAAPEETR